MLKPQGRLYISFPIGVPRVEFNAHRVFHPLEILGWDGCELLELLKFDFVDDSGDLHTGAIPKDAVDRQLVFGCGIYTFRKAMQ
jgi:hypothetical protein